jgi:dihydroxyacid dehydratase/phosphogluconate dehydratase
MKIASINTTKFAGKAKVFEAEEDAFESISKKKVV